VSKVRTQTFDVIVNCRCHKKFEVPVGLTKIQTLRFIEKQIDEVEGDPNEGWTPESFCNKLNNYFENE
jgi:hypothetical protein